MVKCAQEDGWSVKWAPSYTRTLFQNDLRLGYVNPIQTNDSVARTMWENGGLLNSTWSFASFHEPCRAIWAYWDFEMTWIKWNTRQNLKLERRVWRPIILQPYHWLTPVNNIIHVCFFFFGLIGCLTSHATIFQLYMWRYIDVQAGWRRSRTYGRAPNAIDISWGSLTCPSKHRHGTTLFIRLFRETAPFSRLLRHARDTEDTFST